MEETGPTEWQPRSTPSVGVGPWIAEHEAPVPTDARYDPELNAFKSSVHHAKHDDLKDEENVKD